MWLWTAVLKKSNKNISMVKNDIFSRKTSMTRRNIIFSSLLLLFGKEKLCSESIEDFFASTYTNMVISEKKHLEILKTV